VKLLAVQVAGGPNLDQHWLDEETARLQAATGLAPEECLVEVGIWPVEEHLLQRASVRHSDLVVLGSHQRSGLERLWKGSVATSIVHRAPISVACIPDAAVPAGALS
jgi:nucleotide-binding universal stress UspA family protein